VRSLDIDYGGKAKITSNVSWPLTVPSPNGRGDRGEVIFASPLRFASQFQTRYVAFSTLDLEGQTGCRRVAVALGDQGSLTVPHAGVQTVRILPLLGNLFSGRHRNAVLPYDGALLLVGVQYEGAIGLDLSRGRSATLRYESNGSLFERLTV